MPHLQHIHTSILWSITKPELFWAASESTVKKSNTCGVSNNRLYFLLYFIAEFTVGFLKFCDGLISVLIWMYEFLLAFKILRFDQKYDCSSGNIINNCGSADQSYGLKILFWLFLCYFCGVWNQQPQLWRVRPGSLGIVDSWKLCRKSLACIMWNLLLQFKNFKNYLDIIVNLIQYEMII